MSKVVIKKKSILH